MKKIIIVYNPAKKQAKRERDKVMSVLEKKGRGIVKCTACLPTDKLTASHLHGVDLCIALGGDGTIINTAKKLAPAGVPVLGINLGSLGFLAEVDPGSVERAISGLIKSRFSDVEERILASVSIRNKKYLAVNDCVVRSGASTRVILLRLIINDEFLTDYTGDGVIVSTPTGSTAYSLAAGGPIIQPSVPVFCITPICPHTLSQRPLVVHPENRIKIHLPEYKSNKGAILSIDGQENVPLSVGDTVEINKSPHTLSLITTPGQNYYTVLRTKLGWGMPLKNQPAKNA